MRLSSKNHRESVYASQTDAKLSWTQPDPRLSLSLIAELCDREGHRRRRRNLSSGWQTLRPRVFGDSTRYFRRSSESWTGEIWIESQYGSLGRC
jgi:hypothetical protein